MSRFARPGWLTLAAVAGGLAVWLVRGPADAQEPARPVRWEYKLLPATAHGPELEQALNKLADDGWELNWSVGRVSGSTYPSGANRKGGFEQEGKLDTMNYLILRRPKR